MAADPVIERFSKDEPYMLQVEQKSAEDIAPAVIDTKHDMPYKVSWRTLLGLFSLAIAWGPSTLAIVGPASTIGLVVAEYPASAANASWIANSPLFCLVTLPAIIGAAGDRYGKRDFILAGALFGVVGAIISGFATSLEMVIGGQTFTGIGGTCLIMTVSAGMEIVPAKYRLIAVSGMAMINSTLGGFGGVYIYAACVESGLGWRWGYKILACIYALGFVLVGAFYRPPPTTLRKQATFQQLLKSIDFIGIFLLAAGSALLTIALVWGGTAYPWNSSHIIPFLIAGPIVLIAFGVYEWKGRSDGILHHDFFESISFIIFLAFGFVDGMLLYGLSVFIPDQLNAVYYATPFDVAHGYGAFQGCLMAGFLFFGFISTKAKQFRWPLVGSSAILALFCGLTSRSNSIDKGYFVALIGLCGFATAATETIPVAGIALVVPHYLLGTSNQVLGTFRALGGALGIAICTAIYNNKVATFIPEQVTPILLNAGVPSAAFDSIFGVLFTAPQYIVKVPGLTADLVQSILTATAIGAAQGYSFVWYAIMSLAFACLILSFFIKDAPERMTDHIESALERGHITEEKNAGDV